MQHPRRQKWPMIVTVALGGAVVTMGMGVLTFFKHQNEMRTSKWLTFVRQKLEEHPGVKLLLGGPPVKLGTLIRRHPSYEDPSKEVTPSPIHLVTMTVRGDKSKGTAYVWLNKPENKSIESVDDWNVAQVELQIGKNRDNKMPIITK